MPTTKLLLTGLLALVFTTTAFAEHKHDARDKKQHQRQHQHQSPQYQVKYKHRGHKAERHYSVHRESAGYYPQKQSYHRYSGRTVYRAVKHHPKHRDTHRYDRRYEHRLAYDYDRRDAYRLIAGTIVLNEVLHHLHH